MYLSGLGTAVPAQSYRQQECWEALQRSQAFQDLQPRSQGLMRKVLNGDNGIATRSLVLDRLEDAFRLDADTLQRRFERHAPRLATEAAQRALEDAGLKGAQIDAVVVSTCTGYVCPGLSSYVTENLGLSAGVQAFDLVGQGCGAALPNASMAKALLDAQQAVRVLCICVEVCSAAMYLADDPGVLISACLFGDGAGAAIWSAKPPVGKRKVQWRCSASRMVPAERDALRFEHDSGRLRNRLSARVPEVASRELATVLRELLPKENVGLAGLSGWILHAGGRDVLQAIRNELALEKTQLVHSAAVLKEYGNVSSPFVYFVLQRALRERNFGGWWCFSSFGAGFSCQAALLKVE